MKKETREQVKELQDDFRLMNIEARTNVQKGILLACYAVENKAKRLVSRGREEESKEGLPPRVDTGRLRASITHRIVSNTDGSYGEVGTNVSYAPELEFGTSGRKWKHPFMQPALDFNEKKIERILEDAVNAAIEEETFSGDMME
jgi:HK97 gp10 family phage protein